MGTINKELMEKEAKLKQVKGNTKRPKPGSAPKPGDPAVVSVDDDDVWSIPSDDEPMVIQAAGKGGKAAKAAKSTADQDAAAAARKEAKEKRQREQNWKKEIAKASRCMGPLNSTTSSLSALVDKDAKKPGTLAQELVKALTEAYKQINEYKTRASVLLYEFVHLRRNMIYIYRVSFIFLYIF